MNSSSLALRSKIRSSAADRVARARSRSRHEAFTEVERSRYLTLETYATVRRGAGFDSSRFELVFFHPGTVVDVQRSLSKGEARRLSSAAMAVFGIGNILSWRRLEERALESRHGGEYSRSRERTWF
jgi:hypothetical protein